LLADFLFESYRAFGDGVADALSRVERRIEAVEDMMGRLPNVPTVAARARICWPACGASPRIGSYSRAPRKMRLRGPFWARESSG